MNRRTFLKGLGALFLVPFLPPLELLKAVEDDLLPHEFWAKPGARVRIGDIIAMRKDGLIYPADSNLPGHIVGVAKRRSLRGRIAVQTYGPATVKIGARR